MSTGDEQVAAAVACNMRAADARRWRRDASLNLHTTHAKAMINEIEKQTSERHDEASPTAAVSGADDEMS